MAKLKQPTGTGTKPRAPVIFISVLVISALLYSSVGSNHHRLLFEYVSLLDNKDAGASPSLSDATTNANNNIVSNLPGKKALRHSEWKLWHDMSPSEQDTALERAFARAAPYGEILGKQAGAEKFHSMCADGNKPLLFGKGGEHMVCGPRPQADKGCRFFSFGIRDDPSFDIHLAETWNCRGFAGDPSITHPSKLHPAVTFHNVGLTMLRANAEQKKDPGDDWILTSLPRLRQFLGWDYLDIVKIDCEGCEVAMARDILAEDPSFLEKVGQISIETHGTRTWVDTKEELYYYALMFPLLEDAGFTLIWSNVFGCGKYEHDGCAPEMEGKMGMSCGSKPRNAENRVPIGRSCHDWLWARV